MTATDPARREVSQFAGQLATGHQNARAIAVQTVNQSEQQLLQSQPAFETVQVFADQQIERTE